MFDAKFITLMETIEFSLKKMKIFIQNFHLVILKLAIAD